MKARTAFEQRVATANGRLLPISQKSIDWAWRNMVRHISFASKSGRQVCSDCGTQFHYEGKGKTIRCPHCGTRLRIKETRKMKMKGKYIFSTMDVVDSLQVQRVHIIHADFRRGQKAEMFVIEVARLWLDEDGHYAVTARRRPMMGHFADSFIYDSEIELRGIKEAYDWIADTHVAPHPKLLPIFRKRGIKGGFPNVNPMPLLKGLLTNPKVETIVKAGRADDLDYLLSKPYIFKEIWDSYKITLRNEYEISDISLWCDMVNTLKRLGKDVRNPHYVCPSNLKVEHDYWQNRLNRMLQEKRDREELERARKDEADFIRLKSKYFDLCISDGTIEISVLDSIDAFKEESDHMHHCVFSCHYYNHEDSLIMSARINGQRIETIEWSLSQHKILQSRAVCNGISEYHDRIINLVEQNAHLIAERQTA